MPNSPNRIVEPPSPAASSPRARSVSASNNFPFWEGFELCPFALNLEGTLSSGRISEPVSEKKGVFGLPVGLGDLHPFSHFNLSSRLLAYAFGKPVQQSENININSNEGLSVEEADAIIKSFVPELERLLALEKSECVLEMPAATPASLRPRL